jgi:plasmid stabilization system protein ParE
VSYKVRFTADAEEDTVRLYEFVLARDEGDWLPAERALQAIKMAINYLQFSPFSHRKAIAGNSFIRELIIPFGATGYVALFEIESDELVTILAIRHQREDDYL